ncbi:hypothetical protein, partial [Sphingomonas koreensis]|uniref:hypothetical protein n=1 Tax=Sphingomonas koreensis TaxID=93064 RepID=UPI0019D149D8
QPTSVMLATSGFGPAHVLSKVFAKPGESQLTEIAQPNFRSGSQTYPLRAERQNPSHRDGPNKNRLCA